MLHKTTDKQFQLMLEVHNAAPFRIIRAAAKYMRLKDGEPRSIVNVRFYVVLLQPFFVLLYVIIFVYVLTQDKLSLHAKCS
jgi:NAD(P)-dependent dehydrogenase (short-subunit alcohol dehydrogenase family)